MIHPGLEFVNEADADLGEPIVIGERACGRAADPGSTAGRRRRLAN
jgi:hypothetical protein